MPHIGVAAKPAVPAWRNFLGRSRDESREAFVVTQVRRRRAIRRLELDLNKNGRLPMKFRLITPTLASLAVLALAGSAGVEAQQATMTFFLTSAGSGKGADLGGLEGADRRCQQLAQ